ncbi:MAG: PfkB family carbohydrate kinase [Rhodospirillales bacterium]|nr:PfkB family carbohydrate kinase [Rhodospirillales bacterium]
MARVLGIGDNTVDIYVDRGMQFPGGNAVNIAVLTRRLGASSSYLGCVGDDALGRVIRDALRLEGVDTSRMRTMDRPNSWSRIRHDGTDRVFDGSQNNLAGCYHLGADDFAFIAAHEIVHSSVYSRLEDDMAGIGKAAPLLSFDFSTEYGGGYLEDMAPHIDIAFLSDADSDAESCRELCAYVASLGPSVVVITRGTKGAVACEAGRSFSQPIIEIEPIDTLGAGDGFIAAFLMARQQGLTMPEALLRGSEYAAKVCGYLGAFGHQTAIKPGQPGLSRADQSRPAEAGCS